MLWRILNNATIMSWSKAIVNFGSALFVMPLILKVYSPVEQSFWFILNSIIGFALLADSGFGSVLVRATSYFYSGAIYLPRNRIEYDQAEKIENKEINFPKLMDLLSTTHRIYSYLVILVVILLLTGGVAFIWNIMQLAHHRLDLWICYALLLPITIIMVLTIRWSSILRGLNFIAVEARFSLFLGVLRVIAFAILLSFALKPLYLVIILLLSAIANFIFIRNFVIKWFKKNDVIILRKGHFDVEIFKSLWGATWRLGSISWGNYLVETSNSILAAQIPNVQLMANFLFTSRILDFVKNMSYVPFYSKIPIIYSLGAKKDFKGLQKKLSIYLIMGLSILCVSYLVINTLGNPVLAWMGVQVRFMNILFITVMCLSILFDMHASFHASIYASTNHIPFFWPSLISGGIVVLLGYLVTPIYGLLGIILVRFFVQFSFNNWYSVAISLKLLNWKWYDYIRQFPVFGIQALFRKFVKTMNEYIKPQAQ
jgi:hypothetical protein